MFAQFFKRHDSVERFNTAPLGDSRLGYLFHRADHGFKLYTLLTAASMQCMLLRDADQSEPGPVLLS